MREVAPPHKFVDVGKFIERDMNPVSKSHETFWKCVCRNCGSQGSVRKTHLDKQPRFCNKCKGDIISEAMRNSDDTIWKIGYY